MRDSDSKAPLLVRNLKKMIEVELQDAILKDVDVAQSWLKVNAANRL